MLRGIPLGLSFVGVFARTSVRALALHVLGVGILIGLAASALGGTVLGAPGVRPPAVITQAALPACSSTPFTDVPINHEFCPEIQWLKDKNITSGYGDGTYRPDNAATRMAWAAFLARYAQATLSACTVPPFTDVAVSHPFCPEIKWMKDTAISTGYGDGTYRPGNSTTRMAASAFLARVAGATLSACSTPPFSDVPINHPFCPDITWIKDNAISNGNGDGTFGPTLAVTRGESAAWIYRVAVLVNDAPVVTSSAGSTAYTEGDPATVIDAGLTVTDSDDTDLESATVSITGNFQAGDALGFSDQNGISGSWNAATGVLSLTGTSSLANYQAALRSVTFSTTNDNPATTRTISFVANDGDADSNIATKTITITPVNDPPVGGADSAETVPNVQLFYDQTPAAGVPATTKTTVSGDGVLDNDSDPEGNTLSIAGIVGCADASAPFSCATAGGGQVDLSADGTFVFTPDAGDTAADSFQYILSDGTDTSNITVNLTFVGNRIWFVKNDATAGGLGRSSDPFDTLAEAQIAANANGDRVFVYAGDGTTNNQNAGFTFGADNQSLIGEGVGLTTATTVNGIANATLVAVTAQPLIGNAAGNGVSCTNRVSTTITGLSIAGSANAVDLTFTGAATGTYAVTNNTIRGAGAEGIDVNFEFGASGTATISISNNTWNTSGTFVGNAIDISRAAGTLNLDVSNNTNILSTGASGVVIDGGSVAATAIRGFAGNSVHGNTAGAGVVISNVDFDASADPATQQVDGDSLAIGASSNRVGGSGLSITSSQGNLFFDDLDIYASDTGLNLSEAGTGLTFGVLPAAPDGAGTSTIDTNNGTGLIATGVTLSLLLADFDSTTTGAAISLDGVGNLFRAPAGSAITKTSGAGTAVSVSNSSAPLNFTYAGTINVTSGAGIALSNNTGSTFAFSGALTLSTGTNAAFSATGGGTVTTTGSGNTLTTTTGTALNVANTTIGASGLTFQSISANGAANGIVLDSTGSSGGLTVTGDGSNTSLGGNSSGGTISNATGINGATAGRAISLNNTRDVVLRRMTINGTNQNFGIRGTNVTNLTLEYSTVAGVNGTSTPDREGAVIFDNLFGTSAITSSIISGAIEDNVRVENTSGTLTAFNLTNSTIQNNSTVSGNVGFRFATATPGVTMTGTVSGSTFQGNRTIAIQTDASNGTVDFTATNNTIIAGTGGNNQGNQGIEVDVANNGVMTFSVTGNKIGTDGATNQPLLNTGINIFNATLVTSGTPATTSGTVLNNVVYNAGAGMSGFGIRLFNQGYGTMNANVSGNTVSNVGFDYGIFAEVSSNSGTANAMGSSSIGMTNNTSNVLAGALDAIRVQARGRSTMCTRISGNTSATHGTGFFGLEIRQASQTVSAVTYQATFNLEGLTSGLQTDHTTIVNYLNSQNPAITGGADEIHSAGITGVATNSCTLIP